MSCIAFVVFQTYLYLRKDHNLSLLIAEYGLFVIPTMPLVQKVMLETPQFKVTFASLPWERYLGNWYSTPVVSAAVPPAKADPVPVSMPAAVPGALHPTTALFGGITAWAANQPWLQQQIPQQIPQQMPQQPGHMMVRALQIIFIFIVYCALY